MSESDHSASRPHPNIHAIAKKPISKNPIPSKPIAKSIDPHLFDGLVITAIGKLKASNFNISKAISTHGGTYSFGITKKVIKGGEKMCMVLFSFQFELSMKIVAYDNE